MATFADMSLEEVCQYLMEAEQPDRRTIRTTTKLAKRHIADIDKLLTEDSSYLTKEEMLRLLQEKTRYTEYLSWALLIDRKKHGLKTLQDASRSNASFGEYWGASFRKIIDSHQSW